MKNRIWSFPQECPHCHEKSITYFLKLRMIDNLRHNNPPQSRSCPVCKTPLKRRSNTVISVLKWVLYAFVLAIIVFFNLIEIPSIIKNIIFLILCIILPCFRYLVDIPSAKMYIDK